MVRAPAQGWRRTMPLLSGTFTSTGRVLPPLDLPIIPPSSDARHDSARSLREESWENEGGHLRSEEHTSELQSLMRISYAVFCLKKKKDCNETRSKHSESQRLHYNNQDIH